MDEIPTWKTFPLKKWRERNGYTTPEWEAYVSAIKIQDSILTYIMLFVVAIAGYILGRMSI